MWRVSDCQGVHIQDVPKPILLQWPLVGFNFVLQVISVLVLFEFLDQIRAWNQIQSFTTLCLVVSPWDTTKQCPQKAETEMSNEVSDFYQIFTKTSTSRSAASSAWHSCVFLPLPPPLCHSWCAENITTACVSKPVECYYNGAACAHLFSDMSMDSLEVCSQTDMALQFWLCIQCLHHCFSKELNFLCTVEYILSSLDLNNGCFPLNWHHAESLLSACSVTENRMVKVIWIERFSLMVSRLQPWFVISSPIALSLVFLQWEPHTDMNIDTHT